MPHIHTCIYQHTRTYANTHTYLIFLRGSTDHVIHKCPRCSTEPDQGYLYVCAYMCMYVWICTRCSSEPDQGHLYICVYMCKYVWICTHEYQMCSTEPDESMCVCTYMFAYTNIYIKHRCIDTCIDQFHRLWAYFYVCTYTCPHWAPSWSISQRRSRGWAYLYVITHIHTRMHTHTCPHYLAVELLLDQFHSVEHVAELVVDVYREGDALLEVIRVLQGIWHEDALGRCRCMCVSLYVWMYRCELGTGHRDFEGDLVRRCPACMQMYACMCVYV